MNIPTTNKISLTGCFQRTRSCASHGISFHFLKKPYYLHLTDEEVKASRELKIFPKVTQVRRGGARMPGLDTISKTLSPMDEWLF